jgi:hypothetical protein
MAADSFLVVLVTRPYLWWALVALRIWAYNRPGMKPPIASSYVKGVHGPGSLCHGGSTKTSKLEGRVRNSLSAAGFTVLPTSVQLIAPLADNHGNWRKFTPDIMLLHNRKRVIVEVDPYHFHGQDDPGRIFHDVERNYAYSASGWAVVRVRIGWPPENQWRQIGKYDVVIDADDFYPAEHADLVRRAVVRAQRVPASTWNRQLDALAPWADSK